MRVIDSCAVFEKVYSALRCTDNTTASWETRPYSWLIPPTVPFAGTAFDLSPVTHNAGMTTRMIIDTDTASDDAVALVMALRGEAVEIDAITVVAGNVSLHQSTQNALFTRELCGATAPVYAGADRPLLREPLVADFVHGNDGMGDIGLQLDNRHADRGHAVLQLVERFSHEPGCIDLVCLGPLTNIALAIALDRTLAEKVRRCVIMGGAGYGPGNMTPVAEYNFWCDPEAARIVLCSGMAITLVGWDVSVKHGVIDDDDCEAIKKINTPLAHFCVDIQRALRDYARDVSGLHGIDLADPVAMAVALDDSVVTSRATLPVKVVLADDETRGQAVIDVSGTTGMPPNVDVVADINRGRFLSMLHRAVRG